MPCTSFMQVQRDTPHSLHAGARGCPAHLSCMGKGMPRTAFMQGNGGFPEQLLCRGRGMPRTAVMQGQGDAPHSLHAGAGECPAQLSCRDRGMPRTSNMGMPCTAFMQGLPGWRRLPLQLPDRGCVHLGHRAGSHHPEAFPVQGDKQVSAVSVCVEVCSAVICVWSPVTYHYMAPALLVVLSAELHYLRDGQGNGHEGLHSDDLAVHTL